MRRISGFDFELLNEIQAGLCRFLKKHLVLCDENSWETDVLDKIPDFWKNRPGKYIPGSIEELDLSSLLFVFHSNICSFSKRLKLKYEELEIARQIINVRNRWVHHDCIGIDEMQWRMDLKSVKRFAEIIGDGNVWNKLKTLHDEI